MGTQVSAARSTVATILIAGVATGTAVIGQERTADQSREAFEVVSIRPDASPGPDGGRGAGGGGGLARRTRNPRGDNPCSVIVEPQIDARRFDASNATVVQLIAWAYAIPCVGDNGSYVVLELPEWARKEGFDVQAVRPEGPSDYTTSMLSGVQPVHAAGPRLQRMLQTMLEDRFGLRMRRETREMPVYVLSVAKGGPKYTASRPMGPGRQDVGGVAAAGGRGGEARAVDPEFSVWKEGDNPCCDSTGPASIDGRKKPLVYVTGVLEYFLGRPILDRTGLTGDFNFFLNFAPIERPGAPPVRPTEGPLRTQSVFTVLEQVGLELKPGMEKVWGRLIERVQQPTEN